MKRLALVTGVAGGLGRAIAAEFVSQGWDVFGVDSRPAPSDLDLQRFEQLDLSASDAATALVEQLGIEPAIDALVNNAALQVNAPLVATTDAQWDAVLDTNLSVPFRLIRAAHQALARVRGSIVNVASVHALATSPNVAAYAVSKAALVALTRSAALELAPDGIRCNAVLPGAVDTQMLRDGLGRRAHEDGSEGNLRALVGRTPLGFVADPEQIAPTVVHLADGVRSPYTTGAAVVLDGGATLRLGTE